MFPLAMLTLWLLLVFALIGKWNEFRNTHMVVPVAKLAGLIILLAIPFLIYLASGPDSYPPVNPDYGWPETGASQLESFACCRGHAADAYRMDSRVASQASCGWSR